MNMKPEITSGTEKRYVIVHFTEPVDAHYRFAKTRMDWPLHVTLAPWFTISGTEELKDRLSVIAAGYEPIASVIGKEVSFGAQSEIPVNVISDPEPIAGLHRNLIKAVADAGGMFRDERWNGYAYTPHITHHGAQRMYEGEELIVNDFQLVRLVLPKMCEVDTRFSLEGEVR